jgi:hypothetical protein
MAMQRKGRKLNLAKETLLRLEDSSLTAARGGTGLPNSADITCGCVSDACTEMCPSQRVVCREP